MLLIIFIITLILLAIIAITCWFYDEKKIFNNGKCQFCGTKLTKMLKTNATLGEADSYFCEKCGNTVCVSFPFKSK